ncbi:ABC transporter ATP-binding protein [Micromonospora sp. NPDC048843]|uniref:ABC transporter ATP-binding protein n=1 Tax=Micromonospora sp. NPDC048843 TaxID=3155389 RepID=UPI003400DC04
MAGITSAALLGAAYLLAGQGAVPASSAGELFLVLVALATLAGAVGDLLVAGIELGEHSVYLSDYIRLIDDAAAAPRVIGPGASHDVGVADAPPTVELRGVSYTYPTGTEGIRGLDLTIGSGEVVAVMGRNGAGKSTLIALLLGLLTPDRGTVSYDGIELRELGEDRVRRMTGALFQEYGRYEFTVADVVALGRVEQPPDPVRIRAALDDAGLGGLVRSLPDGTGTLLGQQFAGGRDLSVGQWQRLALARMLYRDAPLWVLDEPTAALDSLGEVRFLRRLRDVRRKRTVLVVTHRLTTAAVADRILVMRDGRLVESGTHDELLAAGGEYAGYQHDLDQVVAVPDRHHTSFTMGDPK